MYCDSDDLVCPFDVMGLIEWKGRRSEYFRFIHFDRERRRFVVMPMGRSPKLPGNKCDIVFWAYERVALLVGTVICQVKDFVRPRFMTEDVPMTKKEEKKLARHEEILTPVLSGELALELGFDVHPIDIYMDKSLRETLISAQAERTDARKSKIRELFHSRIWFGGGRRSIMPLYRFRGGPGVGRVVTNRSKVGRPREELRAGKLQRVKSNDGRVTPYWISIFKEALTDFYRGQHLTSFSFVYDQMVERLTRAAANNGGESGKMRINKRRIPLRNTFIYHAKKLVRDMKLDEKYPPPKIDTVGSKGGHAIDVTLGRVVGDVDCTHLTLVELIYANSKEGFVSAGSPLAAFLTDRDSGCIVSWKLVYGRAENSEVYRQLVLKAFLSKDEWLDKIGYEGDRSGFVSGRIDAVCPDRGPGNAKKNRELLANEMRIGVATPPPRTPEGKGHVEGGFGNVKTMLRWVLRQLQSMKGGVISMTKPRGNGRKRTPGVVARLTREILERIVASAVHIVNSRKYRQSHVSRAMISAKYKGKTPADVFRANQERRRGDASIPIAKSDIHERFLERKSGCIRAGKVHARNATHSSKELRAYEATYRSQNGLTARKGIPIEYVIPPDTNAILWLKPGGGVNLLEQTSRSEKHSGSEEAVDDTDIRFRNRLDAATDEGGRQREPAQRARLKKVTHDLIVEQVAAVGELPDVIPRDPAARAALQQLDAREQFYSSFDGAGIDVPELPDENGREGATDLPVPEQPHLRRSKKGSWYRSQVPD